MISKLWKATGELTISGKPRHLAGPAQGSGPWLRNGPAYQNVRVPRWVVFAALAIIITWTWFVNATIAPWCVLVGHYGSRVWRDGLTFVERPKGKAWTVSNGDLLPHAEAWWFLTSLVLFFAMLTLWGVLGVVFARRSARAALTGP